MTQQSPLRPRTDSFCHIDLANFDRGWFERGWRGKLTWSLAGQVKRSVSCVLSDADMELLYDVKGDAIHETFRLTYTKQTFGGQRRWFICPSCARRCRIVMGGRKFRCRHCYQATYPSQYEPVNVPGLAAAKNARAKIGAAPGVFNPWPDKPKGMHWRTYRRLQLANDIGAEAFDCFLQAGLAVR